MKTDRAKSLCAPVAEDCGRDDRGKNMDYCSCRSFKVKHRSHSTGESTFQKCLLALITQQICCFRSRGNFWLSC